MKFRKNNSPIAIDATVSQTLLDRVSRNLELFHSKCVGAELKSTIWIVNHPNGQNRELNYSVIDNYLIDQPLFK